MATRPSKPNPSLPFLVVLSILFISTTPILAFNITRLLNNHPDFSEFNELLSKTGVAEAVNKRKTITVLVVANSDLGDLSSKPESSLKGILATHVMLDYFDEMKINELPKKTALVTNLYQSSGVANKEQGFLNVTSKGGEIVFGSAVKGASHDSKMVKSVAAQPYTISVIQVSKPIIAPGLDQNAPISSSSSPKSAPAHSSPKKSSSEDEESSSSSSEEEEAAEGPNSEEEAEGPEGDYSETEGPILSPGPAPEPAAADEEHSVADESEPKLAKPKNGAGFRVGPTVGGAVVVGLLGLVL